MKNIIFLALLAYSFSALAQPLTLARSVFEAWREPFKSHQGSEPFQTYLTMEIPFEPMKPLFNQIQTKAGMILANRGEAHITTITPVEFDNQLKASRVSMDDVEAIALRHDIQKSPFRILCLGSGSANKIVKGVKVKATAYYLIVQSPALNRIRLDVYKLAKSRDPKTKFNPAAFYPHITVAFLNDDVHESDGLIKDTRTCIAPVIIR